MRITVNGEATEVEENMDISALLKDLGLDPATLVVELNHNIVPRESFDQQALSPGDELELVRFVGGG
jgi:sulfur carrier protein